MTGSITLRCSATYAATGSATWVGAATICRLLPYVLLGPIGGAIADRFPRRSVLAAGDVLRLTLMLGLVAAVAADGPVEVVIALTTLASAAGSAERPAALALMPRLVGESRLGAANALLHTVQELGVVVGPAIGAILLAAGPNWLAFAVNAATFAVSAGLVSTIRDRSWPPRVRGSTAAQVAYGLRTARTTAFVVPLFSSRRPSSSRTARRPCSWSSMRSAHSTSATAGTASSSPQWASAGC